MYNVIVRLGQWSYKWNIPGWSCETLCCLLSPSLPHMNSLKRQKMVVYLYLIYSGNYGETLGSSSVSLVDCNNLLSVLFCVRPGHGRHAECSSINSGPGSGERRDGQRSGLLPDSRHLHPVLHHHVSAAAQAGIFKVSSSQIYFGTFTDTYTTYKT